MASATIVKKIIDIGDPQYESNLYAVELEDGQGFQIKAGNLSNNYAIIVKTRIGTTLEEIAEIIEGCFNKKSNFFKEVSNYFECNKLIQLKYDNVSLMIYPKDVLAERIVNAWNRNKKRLSEGIYFIIGVRKLRKLGEFDGTCLVLASTEESAINKVKKRFPMSEYVCIGKYNKKDNTFLLKNAQSYLKLNEMYKIED